MARTYPKHENSSAFPCWHSRVVSANLLTSTHHLGVLADWVTAPRRREPISRIQILNELC